MVGLVRKDLRVSTGLLLLELMEDCADRVLILNGDG